MVRWVRFSHPLVRSAGRANDVWICSYQKAFGFVGGYRRRQLSGEPIDTTRGTILPNSTGADGASRPHKPPCSPVVSQFIRLFYSSFR
jgi:hypothetical protein